MNPALETLIPALFPEGESLLPARSLFLGAELHAALRAWPDLTGWQPNKALADPWDRAGLARSEEPPPGRWPLVLVLPGKSRDEILAAFAMARDRLETGGRIVAALPNTLGAARFEKEFARATGKVVSLQKNKCRAFQAIDDGTWDEARFASWREAGEPQTVPGTTYRTQAGIFSHGRIDSGSRLLVEHLPPDLRGKGADLGAGWGYLAAEALRRCPGIENIALFESDFRALACARSNLADQSLRAAFHWRDVAAGIPGRFDFILTNPPFHSGRETDLELGRVFLKTAAASLNHRGRLWLVANRQLPYEAVLRSAGLVAERIVENKDYKVLAATSV